MLLDGFGRAITNLRLSVTDRCNLRCVYCMPSEPEWMPQPEILSFEEIERLARVAVSLGITEFRITGGEPTARKDLPELVRRVAAIPGVRDLAMTTNGILLGKLARPLREAGLKRLNVSLDTLRGEKFIHIARRDGFRQTWEGIEEADRVGFRPLKINMVVMRGVNDDEIVDFAAMARTRPWQIRYIEFMPLDGDNVWTREQVVTAKEILAKIHAKWPLDLVAEGPLSDPARIFRGDRRRIRRAPPSEMYRPRSLRTASHIWASPRANGQRETYRRPGRLAQPAPQPHDLEKAPRQPPHRPPSCGSGPPARNRAGPRPRRHTNRRAACRCRSPRRPWLLPCAVFYGLAPKGAPRHDPDDR